MRISSSVFTIAVSGLVLAALCAPVLGAPRSVHHDLAVTLHPETHRLSGVDRLVFEAKEETDLQLSLKPDAQVISVSLAQKAVPYFFEQGKLGVVLPNEFRNREIELTISYDASFQDPVPVNPIHTEDPSYGVTGVISSEGAFLLPGAGWYPHMAGSRADFRLEVQAPSGYEAVTAGRSLLRKSDSLTTTCVWQVAGSRKGLALSAGPYVVQTAHADGIPVYTYFFPEDDHLAGEYLEATKAYLRLYTNLFGPYPFEKFAVVENFFPTGYGFPSYTLLGKTVIRLPFIVKTSLGHEVAHAWWGNGVLVDYGGGNWSEGLTAYVADHLFQERSSAEEARAYRLKILRDYATLVSPEDDFPLQVFMSRVDPPTRAIGYGKAAMVFHMARRLVGDDAFWRGLRQVFAEKLFERASWDDFAEAMSMSRGKDLRPFFNQWVARAGAPILKLEGVKASRVESGWKVQGRVCQEAPYFDLQVPVSLETEGPTEAVKVFLIGQETSLTFRSVAVPKKLVVDPDVDLFRRLDPSEVPPVVNSVKGSRSLLVVASPSLTPETLAASMIILKALGQDGAPVMSEQEVTPSRLSGCDVLYLGLPGEENLPLMPDGLVLSQNQFAVDGITYDSPDDALFSVFTHSKEPGKVAGLFLPLSPEAALKAGRKIPHYGKYSTLVFRKGVNQRKSVWPVSSSPLIHVFTLKEAPP